MSGPFNGKNIALGVTGSIAIYKVVDLASKLTQAGAQVNVLMTPSAERFVSALTFRSITHRPVLTDLFDAASPEPVEHVALAKTADILVIAPATANILAKLAWGFAEDPVSLTALVTDAPILVAPAMDGAMWGQQATRDNVDTLRARGVAFAGPVAGHLASGLEGTGRMVEVPELMGRIALSLGRLGDLRERRIVVSAGGTQEPIDPVRIIGNRSSGKMGYAIAEAARDRGAHVILVAAPTALPDLAGVKIAKVETAEEMREAVSSVCFESDALIMAAAVADYRPKIPAASKVKKQAADWSLELERTQDILAEAPKHLVRVGFAAESTNLVKNATAKLRQKDLDLIVANDITREGSGFGADTNQVTLLNREGTATELPVLPKYEVAMQLLDRVRDLLDARDARGDKPARPLPS
jgi:phosphopantothenoylcysteine decarboxylase/phosphopantothenate--cysteine ligase